MAATGAAITAGATTGATTGATGEVPPSGADKGDGLPKSDVATLRDALGRAIGAGDPKRDVGTLTLAGVAAGGVAATSGVAENAGVPETVGDAGETAGAAAGEAAAAPAAAWFGNGVTAGGPPGDTWIAGGVGTVSRGTSPASIPEGTAGATGMDGTLSSRPRSDHDDSDGGATPVIVRSNRNFGWEPLENAPLSSEVRSAEESSSGGAGGGRDGFGGTIGGAIEGAFDPELVDVGGPSGRLDLGVRGLTKRYEPVSSRTSALEETS